MKRLLLILLICTLLTSSLIACAKGEQPGVPAQPNGSEQPQEPERPKVEPVIAPDELETVRQLSQFKETSFAFEGGNTALRIKIPQEWTCLRKGDAFELLKDGILIGQVTQGVSDNKTMTVAKTLNYEGVTVKIYTGILTLENVTEPYYRIGFSYQDGQKFKTVTVEVKQSEVDATFIRWCAQPEALVIQSYNSIPTVLFEEGNGAENMLLIGNSFLFDTYSNIIKILRHLTQTAPKKEGVPYSFANGYATIATCATGTEEKYVNIRGDIESGAFNIVFLCGLYGAEDVEGIAVIKRLCDASNTRLVLLPAHNESRALIEEAKTTYPTLPCLDWKAEIDDLIKNGVDEEEFVNDDAHGHSKPLAGYVGAHMIYRCIYGEIPPTLLKGAAIDQSYVDSMLGSYVYGGITRIDESEIRWFRS